VVIGIVLALLLWMLGEVDQYTMVILLIVLAIVGGVAAGVPAIILRRKIAKARVQSSPQVPPSQPAPVAVAPLLVQPVAPPEAKPVQAKLTWPLFEPLCVMRTGAEKEVLELAGSSGVPNDRLLVFLTQVSEVTLPRYGLESVETVRLSRVEGEDVVSPGDLEKLGYIIEKHFSRGQGYKVVLPSVESLVEAAGIKNVRRLLDVARELAQGAAGSVLFSLDTQALSPDQVAILERGAFKITAQPG
jgi:hypothetical protein